MNDPIIEIGVTPRGPVLDTKLDKRGTLRLLCELVEELRLQVVEERIRGGNQIEVVPAGALAQNGAK